MKNFKTLSDFGSATVQVSVEYPGEYVKFISTNNEDGTSVAIEIPKDEILLLQQGIANAVSAMHRMSLLNNLIPTTTDSF